SDFVAYSNRIGRKCSTPIRPLNLGLDPIIARWRSGHEGIALAAESWLLTSRLPDDAGGAEVCVCNFKVNGHRLLERGWCRGSDDCSIHEMPRLAGHGSPCCEPGGGSKASCGISRRTFS